MRVLRLFTIIVALFMGISMTHAQDERPYTGLDIVFLVDQSNSMSGVYPANSATDPDGLRFQALQYALNTLDDYRAVVPVGTTFRMAVVYFGDTAETVVNWTTIGDTPAWTEIKRSISRTLSGTSPESDGRINTNFLDAFEVARDLYSDLSAPAEGQHLQVIVVLTDGAPCAPIREDWTDKTCSSDRDRINHINAVEDLAEDAFSGSNFQIHLIAIDQTNAFYPLYRSNWERITGDVARAVQINSTDDIGPNFLKILSELTQRLRDSEGEDSIIGQQIGFPDGTNFTTIAVPPYYQSMRLTVFRPNPTATITLIQPDGTSLTSGSAGVNITSDLGDIEVWTIIDPIPGQWSLSTSVESELIDVFLDLIRVETQFSFSPTGTVPPFSQVLFQFDVLGSNGLPLRTYTDPRFALTVNTDLTLPDGSVKRLPMNMTAPGSYTASYPVEQAGVHTISVNATTLDLNDATTSIAQLSNAGSFTVSDSAFTVTGFPASRMLVGDPITLTAQFTSVDGTPINADGLEVIAQMSRFNESAESVVLEFPLLRAEDNSYRETFRPENEGQYRITVQVRRDGVNLNQASSGLFLVSPADLILLQFVPQISTFTHQATTGYPPQDAPFTVAVQTTRDADGQPFDLETLATGEQALSIALITQNSEIVVPTDITLQSVTGNIGLYRATFPKLEAETYTVQVRANENVLAPTSLRFHPTTRVLNATLEVTVDPSVVIITTIIIVAAVIILLAIIFLIARAIRLGKYPATGTLQLVEYEFNTEMKTALRTYNLARYKSNYIVLPGSKLPKHLNIKRIIIKAGTPSHSQRKAIDITIMFNDGTPLQSTQLTPGYDFQFIYNERGTVSLIKDANDFDY